MISSSRVMKENTWKLLNVSFTISITNWLTDTICRYLNFQAIGFAVYLYQLVMLSVVILLIVPRPILKFWLECLIGMASNARVAGDMPTLSPVNALGLFPLGIQAISFSFCFFTLCTSIWLFLIILRDLTSVIFFRNNYIHTSNGSFNIAYA